MKSLLIYVSLVLAGVAGWFFVSPLLIDKTVDESFEFAAADGSFDMDKAMAMPPAERMEMKAEILDAAASAPDKSMAEPMPPPAPRALSRGHFVDADAIHKGSGEATLYALSNGQNLIRFQNFRVTNGPALVVYLAKHPSPETADDVTDGGFINLGELKGNVGNQNYLIPKGTDISEFNSVVVWCELFGVLFSPATLVPIS